MKRIFGLILFLAMIFIQTKAQDTNSGFGIKFNGFVKTDMFYDSRQTVSAREGHFLLYPTPEVFDKNGEDINAKGSLNILSIQSRLTGNIYGPNAFGAKTSGQIEAEFFGTVDGDINGFRLRHAFAKLAWEKVDLLIGQTWHPMFVAEMYPNVISFNTGVPFQPFARNPQIRLSYKINDVKLIFTALSQRDFQSNGPTGFSSSYLRNSIIPNINAQLQYISERLFWGGGIDYKKLTPRLVTTQDVKTDASISTISVMGYLKLSLTPVTIKFQGILGSNLTELFQLGGYAVKSVNAADGTEEYTPLKSLTAWGEISTGNEIEYGIFFGYSKSLGADDNIAGSYYGRGINIDNVLRISPRIQFNSNKNRIGIELEYTSAGYGVPNDLNKGKVENIKTTSNLRLLTAFYYFF